MRCVRLGRVLPLLAAAVASVVAARATPAAVQLSVSSATVAQAGDSGRICVALSTNGEEVAGTENRLVWDGSCATLPQPKSTCYEAGSHGKQLNWVLVPNTDFTMKGLVLSLSDTDPIEDGVLYCCNFQGEAAAGSCCSITVVAPGASDSKGTAIKSVLGSSGSICTARSQGGGPIGRVDPGRPLGASNADPLAADARVAPGAGAVAPGGAAAPPVQVLQGGGAVAPTAAPEAADAPGAVPADAAAAAAAPSPAVVPPATVAAALVPAVAASPAAAIQAPTAALSASAAPTAADTPTAAVPTAVATKAVAAAAGSAPAAAAPAASRGWFGCQIGGGSAAPVFALGLVFAVVAWVRRRSTPHR